MTSAQPVPEPVATIAVSAGSEALLTVNSIVNGEVVADLGGGRFLLRFGASRVIVESDQPLAVHQPLTARVLQNGERLVLELAANTTAASSPAAPAEGIADNLAISAPFAVAVAAGELAKAAGEASIQPWLALGFTPASTAIMLHFPETGTAIQGYAAAPPGIEMSLPPSSPLMSTGAAVFLVEQMFLRAAAVSAPGEPLVVVQMPIAELKALQEVFAGNLGTAVDAAIFAGRDNRLLVKIGGAVGVLLASADAMPIALSAAKLRFEPTIWLAGSLCRDQEAIAAIAHPLDARIKTVGLTPTPLLREAALALLREGILIERQPLQALLALAAGRSDNERSMLFSAAARLWAQDAPLCLPLAAGAAVPPRQLALLLQGCDAALVAALAALSPEDEAAPLLRGARQALEQTAVSLGTPESAAQLADFLAASGRTTLARAQALVEETCRMMLGRHPLLRNCDSALEAIRQAFAPPRQHDGVESAAVRPAAEQIVQALRQAVQAALPGIFEGEHIKLVPGAAEDGPIAVDKQAAAAARLIIEARDPEAAAEMVRRFIVEHPSLARDLAACLEKIEAEALQQQPAVRSLAEAAQTLSEIGRRLLAYRAESLSGLKHEPAYFVAEIPLRFNEDREDGLLRVYWRRRSRLAASWNARVVLDLHTTRLGPVVGDMLFYGREIRLRLYAAEKEIADYLAASQGELAAALREKGFICTPRFAVIPQPGEVYDETLAVPSPAAARHGGIDLEA